MTETSKTFYSLLYTSKQLAVFPLSEEEAAGPVSPLTAVSSGHGLALHTILSLEDGELVLLGRDGRISLHSAARARNTDVLVITSGAQRMPALIDTPALAELLTI